MPTKYRFVVEITPTEKTTLVDAQLYVFDAVRSMGGCHNLDSPFFGLDDDDVNVRPLKTGEE